MAAADMLDDLIFSRQPYWVCFEADNGDGHYNGSDTRWPVPSLDEANCISSEIAGTSDMHAPVLDLDFGASLVPSATEGHYHLYLDKALDWETYEDLLRALGNAGILEQGYVNASIERRATFVRKPGVSK